VKNSRSNELFCEFTPAVRTFSAIDDIGGTPHLVENRFRLNGAAAIFEIITRRNLPSVNSRENKKILYFAYVVISIPVKCYRPALSRRKTQPSARVSMCDSEQRASFHVR